jgi:hypothetical protein
MRKKKQFCPKGHDTFICGRETKSGRCKMCIKLDKQKYHQTPQYKEYQKKYRNSEIGKQHITAYQQTKTYKEYQKQYQLEHLEQFREYNKIYYENNKEQIIKRKLSNPLVRLAVNLRNRLRAAIKNNQKKGSAVKDLGCTIDFLKKYLEKKFYAGMTWNNYGTVWEIDHIKALWKFDLEDRKQFLKACHYTNLQPLTIPDHDKKVLRI